MRNKKIIALVCALSMIFSIFAGFTVVNAAIEQGIELEITQTSNTAATLTAKYVGYENGVSSTKVVFNLPDGVTVTKHSTPLNPQGGLPNTETAGEYSYTIVLQDNTKADDHAAGTGTLAVFELSFANGLSKNETIALKDTSEIGALDDDFNTVMQDGAKLPATSATLKKDINEVVEETPTPLDKPTVTDAPKPSAEAVVEVGDQGIDLVATKTDDTHYALVAKYVGYPNGVSSTKVVFNLPDGATVTKHSTPLNPQGGLPNTETAGEYSYTIVLQDNTKAADHADGTGTLAEFELTLTSKLAEDTKITLKNTSEIGTLDDDFNTVMQSGDQLNLVSAVLEADSAADDRETVALKDKITPDDVKNAVADATDKANTYLAIEATKDGNPVAYGPETYEAYYNGVKLTEDQLNNLLAGAYANDAENPITLEDVAKGLTFKYNKGVNIKMQLVADGEVAAEKTTDNGEEPAPSTKPSDKSADGKIASNVSKSLKSTDSKQTATFTTTAAKDKDGAAIADNDKVAVTINIKKTSYDAITGAGIEVAYQANKDAEVATAAATTETKYIYPGIAQAGTEVEIPVSVDGKYVVSFTPAAKGTVEYTITYTDANGKKSTATAKYTIAAASTEKSSSGSGSGSSSSGGGAIASGLVDTTIGGYIPGIGFSDMADASWANEAVNALANQKIVSGVGDNKFDPNGELTRAAYAQMLVNAIGHSQDSADVEFNDVPTDAWFYHNVAVAAQLGIVSGYGDGNFGPNDLITREQMALMTQKAAQVTGVSLAGADAGTFTDDADIADWSRDAVYTLANAGIINGMGDGTFAPKANATRAQAAVIIYNTFVK